MELIRKWLNIRIPNPVFWGALLLLGAIGITMLVYATPFGPGLINDSVIYLGGAENILEGHGYSRTSGGGEIKAITVNPPFYPILVAAVSLAGFSFIKSALLISLACFLINAVLVGAILRKLTHSDLFAIFGVALFVVSDSFIAAHTFALTEPLFITLSLGAVLCLAEFLDHGKIKTLILSAILVSLSYLTRYIGIANLAVGLLSLLVFLPGWGKKIRNSLIFLGVSLIGGTVWLLRNMLAAGTAANRSIGFHPLTADKIREGVVTFWAWLLPERFNLVDRFPVFWDLLTYTLLACLVVGAAFVWIRTLKKEKTEIGSTERLALVVTAWAVAYFGALLFSLTFADASTALENRILAPMFVFLLMLFVYGLGRWLSTAVNGLMLTGLAVMVIMFLSLVYDGRREVIDLRVDGQGYASSYFRNSPTIEAVKNLPEDIILYSNRVPAINLLAERNAYALLAPIDPLTREQRPDYHETLLSIRERLMNGEVVVVIFEAQSVFEDPIEGGWLRDLTQDVPVMTENSDGIIYGTIKQ
ncbi:MAG: glycosyltransferase family 39 protein [Anaerolineaceae bacterium]